jgi:hypothetical protein
MLWIADHPGMVVPVPIVLAVPIPLASLDYAGGSSQSDQSEHEAPTEDPPPGHISCILHVAPFLIGLVSEG